MGETKVRKPHEIDPYAEQLPGGGASVMVWLLIGGAILAGFIYLWEIHNRRLELAEAAEVEREVRQQFKASFRLLREDEPSTILLRDAETGKLLDWLLSIKPNGYIDLRITRLLIRAGARLRLRSGNEWALAEQEFTEGIALMSQSGGSAWVFGFYGRGQARLKKCDYAGAASDFDALLSFNSSFGAAYYWRARARSALADVVGAFRDAERARALDSWPPHDDFTRDFSD